MNLQNVLNTIRANASTEYQERIPEANADNMESIRYSMIDGDNVMVANEFMATLLNKLIKSVVIAKMFSNPLKGLKKGTKPLGDTIEEIYNNFLKGEEYDPSGKKLMERNLPDTKTVYHRMNHQMQYPITVGREQLSKAFMSYDNLDSFINNIIQSLYNSAELDEFVNTKELIRSALNRGVMKRVYIPDPCVGGAQGEANGKEFIKAVKTTSGLMSFPSTEWNSYLDAQDTDDKAITTFSRKNEQVLIIDTATDTSVAVDVLASVFNLSIAEFNDTKKIVIDTFPDPDVRAVLVDEQFFQIYDDLFTITSFYNGQGLYHNYYLNVWQTMAYSILVNGVAFAVANDKDGDGEVDKYSVTLNDNHTNTFLGAKLSMTNKRKTVDEGSSYTNTLNFGENYSPKITVTMGGETVVDGVTNIESVNGEGKYTIRIPEVTGNIDITINAY